MEALQFITNYRGTNYYLGDVTKDVFIHFTLSDRANGIKASGALLNNPPYEKFGIDGVQAVSSLYGTHVPGVQTTHLRTPDFVAVVFRTNAQPKVGHCEEVIWPGDVPVSDFRIVQPAEAVSMLRGTDENICVIYDPNHPWLDEMKKRQQPPQPDQNTVEAWVRRNCKFSV